MESVKTKMERWFRQRIWVSGEGQLARLVLLHSNAGTKGSIVVARDFSHPIDPGDIGHIVDDFYQAMEDDCNGMGGVQRYIVAAYDTEKGVISRLPIRIEGRDEEIDAVNDAEPPTKSGIMAMQMRHNEQVMQKYNAGIGEAFKYVSGVCNRLSDANEMMMKKLHANFELIEEMSQERHVREMEMMEVQSKEDRQRTLFNKGMMLLPAVANKLVGKKILPEDLDPLQLQLKEFADSLTPGQFTNLQTLLGPEQQISLITLLQGIGYGSDEAGKGTEEETASGGNGKK